MTPKYSGGNTSVSTRIAVVLLVPGVLSLMFSILYESQIPAFVGLGLIFWGALFFLIRPVKYVTGDIVYASALSSYSTIDRIIKNLGLKGDAYHIPPYPKDVYLPNHLKGLKEPVVFLSATKDSVFTMPSIEEMAASRFQLESSNGALITSPGAGLLSQIEKELNADSAKMKLADLCEALPRVVSENLSLAREMELQLDGTVVQLKLFDSLFKNLYSKENDFRCVSLLGCPIASAVACAIAKSSGKPVTIQKLQISPDGMSIGVRYALFGE